MPVIIPYVPRNITVHLGPPSQWAENVTVTFPDYVKNVASSEIYPTWEPAAIRANVLAIVSFALNRVYTEFYPSRGYDFQITSTTQYDQKFIRGRNIFENISQIVDEIFNDYIRRQGYIEPLAAKFCNGTTSTCDGLSQWGSQEMAQEGANSMDILYHYYGDDIELVVDAPIRDISESYPGTPLRPGDAGVKVSVIQITLNRIAQNYPAIPRIPVITGVFDEATEAAVRAFQRIFSLTVDGIVGKATWYKMVYLYVGVLQLAELVSEGQNIYTIQFQFSSPLSQGDSGGEVEVLQYMLAVLAQFDNSMSAPAIDGQFGPATAQAVRVYQQLVGLTPNGLVDETTWNSIYNHFAAAEHFLRREILRAQTLAEAAIPAMADSRGGQRSEGMNEQSWLPLERDMLTDPVSSLQYMLRQLSRTYTFLPELVVDGVFGERTLEAVMRFQQYAGLPVTGTVDQATWEAIRGCWLSQRANTGYSRPIRLFPSEGVEVKEGQTREYLIVPQTMFNVLSKQFEGIVHCDADGCNGPASAENIRWLQKAAGLPANGCMDTATWDVLSHLYEIFVVQDTECQPEFTGGWG